MLPLAGQENATHIMNDIPGDNYTKFMSQKWHSRGIVSMKFVFIRSKTILWRSVIDLSNDHQIALNTKTMKIRGKYRSTTVLLKYLKIILMSSLHASGYVSFPTLLFSNMSSISVSNYTFAFVHPSSLCLINLDACGLWFSVFSMSAFGFCFVLLSMLLLFMHFQHKDQSVFVLFVVNHWTVIKSKVCQLEPVWPYCIESIFLQL